MAAVTITTPDDVRLVVETAGRGSPAVLVPNRIYLFDAFAGLASERTLVFIDPRNRGRSGRVDDRSKLERGIDHDIDDLEAVRRHFGFDRVDLIGHSYMGLVVALYTRKYPEHVGRVVQIGTVGPDGAKSYPPELSNTDAIGASVFARLGALQADRDREDPQAFCRRFWAILRELYVADPSDAGRLAWEPCDVPNELAFMTQWLEHVQPSIQRLRLTPEDLARIAAPVLVVHGRLDRSSPYGAGRDWAQALPNARLLTIGGAAHVPWIEEPERVLGAIDTFLSGGWPADAESIAPPRG